MDKDIDNFCERILPYVDDFNSDLDYFISILIREIRTNDIIYINKTDEWYEYNMYNKEWNKYDFSNIINQIKTFDEFFSNYLYNFINSSNLGKKNKDYLIKINKKIISFIKNRSYNTNKIYNNCKKLFSINNLV